MCGNRIFYNFCKQVFFEMAYDEGFVLKVSDYGRQIVSGEASIELAEEIAKPKRSFAKKETGKGHAEPDLFSELRLLNVHACHQ